jgi:hypothetical protein
MHDAGPAARAASRSGQQIKVRTSSRSNWRPVSSSPACRVSSRASTNAAHVYAPAGGAAVGLQALAIEPWHVLVCRGMSEVGTAGLRLRLVGRMQSLVITLCSRAALAVRADIEGLIPRGPGGGRYRGGCMTQLTSTCRREIEHKLLLGNCPDTDAPEQGNRRAAARLHRRRGAEAAPHQERRDAQGR